MARYTGAVRFPDGEIKYFVYNGTVDMARPTLFSDVDEADLAWDDPQINVPRYVEEPLTDVVIEVMPYFSVGDSEVMFLSRSNQERALITGPLSLDRAMEESGHDS